MAPRIPRIRFTPGARPTGGRSTSIVPYGTKAGNSIPKVTKEGKGLLSNLFPKSLGGRLLLGAELGLAGLGIAGAGAAGLGPGSTRETIINRDKLASGDYDIGPVGAIYEGIDTLLGGNTAFDMDQSSLSGYERRGIVKDIEGSNAYSEAVGYLGADKAGILSSDKSPAAYAARLGSQVRSAKAAEKFNDPTLTYLRQQTQLNRDRDYNLRLDTAKKDFQLAQERLSNQLMQIQGGIDNTALQIQTTADANKERMYYYAQDLAAKRENDRYKTTMGLVSALGSLGAAFAL